MRGRRSIVLGTAHAPELRNRPRRLLTRAFEAPKPPTAAVRCVYASLDPRAQALYLKFGMYPRGRFYLLQGKPLTLPRPKLSVAGRGTRKTSSKMLAVAAKYDRIFREARRDADI